MQFQKGGNTANRPFQKLDTSARLFGRKNEIYKKIHSGTSDLNSLGQPALAIGAMLNPEIAAPLALGALTLKGMDAMAGYAEKHNGFNGSASNKSNKPRLER